MRNIHTSLLLSVFLILINTVPSMHAMTIDPKDKALFDALRSGQDLPTIKDLVSKGANVDAIDGGLKNTALHIAIEEEVDNEIIKYLVDQTSNIDAEDCNQKTPLYYAISSGFDQSVIQYLVEHGADVNAEKSGQIPLYGAIKSAKWDTTDKNEKNIQYLVKKEANLKFQNEDGETPLYYAIDRKAKESIVKLLISKDNVNLANKQGNYSLHLAIKKKMPLSLIKNLVAAGANINQPDHNNDTPLHIASTRGSLKIIKYLVDRGADEKAKGKNNDTVLHRLDQEKNTKEIIKYFVDEKGVDIDAVNNDGDTALHLSATRGYQHPTLHLIDQGAKLDIKNNKGQTPLEASEAISSRSAMTDLLKAGKRLVNPVSPLASPVPPLDTTSNSNNNSNLGKTLVVVVGIFGLGIIIFRVTRPEEEKAPQKDRTSTVQKGKRKKAERQGEEKSIDKKKNDR